MKNQLKNWLSDSRLDSPLIISGPCSAETENQVLKIAHQLKYSDTTVLRAGIWKPRTRPGNFEGVGVKGLKWLQRAKKETGLLTATEVASSIHAEQALKHDVDILWIGARTTVNPFLVQEIANALQGTSIPVLIKNPVNPDLNLWLGAIERFLCARVSNIGAIHRGFCTYQKTKYRNTPFWEIPIELKSYFKDIPLILDPSHIAGRRDLIFKLLQKGSELNYDGFMLETHHDPDQSWSDAKQQITPKTLIRYTEKLKQYEKTDLKEICDKSVVNSNFLNNSKSKQLKKVI